MSNDFSVGGIKSTISDFGIGDLLSASESGALITATQPGRRGRRQATTKKRMTQASLLAPLLAAEGCLSVGKDEVPLDSIDNGSGGGSATNPGVTSTLAGTSQFAQDDTGFNTDTSTDIRISTDDLLENDIASQGETLQLVRVFGASNGTVSLAGNIVTFTPNPGYTGPASFSYEAQSANGQLSQASVQIQVADDTGGGHSGGGHSGGSAMHDPAMAAEHQALMDLVKHADATHVAVQDGSWFDPATWASGQVPGDGAKVLISDGVTVTYDGQSPASLFTVRVDGALEFATDIDTFMEVDTFVVSKTGSLQIGTIDNPVEAGVDAIIQIAENGPIDVSWDPMLLSRGVISHGDIEIHGAEKEAFLKVATDPMVGDTSITLDGVPAGWEIGDTVVLTGTRLTDVPWSTPGSQRNITTQDEELTITGIQGNTITFATPLQFHHDTPRADLKAYVANYSRNIKIETENADGVPISERGHVMFMHSGNVDVRYAEFHELGRTDKSQRAFDFDDLASTTANSNLKGRYSLHIHRAGLDDLDDPALLVGNAVWGSPGWGLVHHDSNAVLTDNAAYDVFGAAFVAETGNETGRWSHNIAIKSLGVGGTAKDGADLAAFDLGRTGAGFWFQGRLVSSVDNVAASVPGGHGFVYMSRGWPGDVIDVLEENVTQPEALRYLDSAVISVPPIVQFSGNEALATKIGLEIIKAHPHQGSDIRSVLEDFTAWEVQTGAYLQYTGHYSLIDFDLVASRTSNGDGSGFKGIGYGPNTIDMVVNGANIDGFEVGIELSRHIENLNHPFGGEFGYVFVDVGFDNVVQNYTGSNASDLKLTSSQLSNAPFAFNSDIVGIPQGPASHQSPDSAKTNLSGTKTDGIGNAVVSPDWDPLIYDYFSLRGAIEEEGYWTLPDGRVVTAYDQYVADRLTGELHKTSTFVEVLNTNFTPGAGFVRTAPTDNGILDLNSAAPVARTDFATVTENTSIVIDVLANDFDPDGDSLSVDGMIQADHGRIFDNGDGTISYTPDPNFVGHDYFWYWVEDSNGNFDRAHVQVTVEI